jgi:hypothetical protein
LNAVSIGSVTWRSTISGAALGRSHERAREVERGRAVAEFRDGDESEGGHDHCDHGDEPGC